MIQFSHPSAIKRDWEFITDDFAFCGQYLCSTEADAFFEECRTEFPWQSEIVPMFGRKYVAPRLSCAIADPGCTYRYRGSQSVSIAFPESIDCLRRKLENDIDARFNYVLANRYRDGNDHVGWHSDDERDMGMFPTIASLSLGATRKFKIASRSNDQRTSIDVCHGSLLLMFGESQRRFKHALMKTKTPVGERINLSFRYVSN